MNLEHLDPNHFARQGAFTKQIFRDVYPSIDPTSPAMSQRGKVIVISGAGSGIGASGIVPAFAKAGARAVILVGRRAANIHDTAVNLRQHFPSIQVIEAPIDITESEAIETLHASIEADFGHADVLVNNAGVQSGPAKIAESDDLKWWADFEINTRGTYLITRMFLKLLSTNGHGFIINITSGASTVILPTMSSYGISKLAVNRMTEYVAAESPNVVSITLDPGTVNTDMLPGMFQTCVRTSLMTHHGRMKR